MCPTKRPDSTWPSVDKAAPTRRTRIVMFWTSATILRAFILVPQLLKLQRQGRRFSKRLRALSLSVLKVVPSKKECQAKTLEISILSEIILPADDLNQSTTTTRSSPEGLDSGFYRFGGKQP